MDKNQRIKDIIDELRREGFADIKGLKTRLGVSEMTIRRDLGQLASDGIVKAVPGGAIIAPAAPAEEDRYIVTNEEAVHTREKVNIGRKAATLLEPNDSIIIDIGSTTEYLAKFAREDVPLSVLCYSVNILFELYRKKNCSLIFPGGYYHDDELMFESPEGLSLIRRTRADKAFVSAAGVHPTLGVTTVYPYELEVKRAIMQSAKTRVLLADSSKFGKTKSVYFADLEEFDLIITDSALPEARADEVRALGITLVLV